MFDEGREDVRRQGRRIGADLAEQVRSAIVGPHLWLDLAMTLAPAPFIVLAVAAFTRFIDR